MRDPATWTDLAGGGGAARAFFGIALTVALALIGVLMLCCLVRAVRGPRVADRIIAVNMMGTMVVIIICGLAWLLEESWLTDTAMIYTLLSFLAVVLLTRIYTGVWRQRHHREQPPKGGEARD